MRATIFLIIGIIFLFSGCKKDAYLTDDGLHSEYVNQSTYDYLANHPQGMFDTLLLIIDHFGLKEELNSSKTFWAPSDYSIKRFYKVKEAILKETDENAEYTFEKFLTDISVDSLRAYMYSDAQHSLSTAKTSYIQLSNNTSIDGFAYNKQKQPQGQWSYQDVFYLYYIKVRGDVDQTAPDGSIRVDRNDQADVRVYCQTTGIKTNTGTVINVLNNLHTFILDFNESGETGPLIEDIENGGLRFTYSVAFKAASSYSGTTVTIPSAWVAETFALDAEEIPSIVRSSIAFGAIEPNGTFNTNYTATAPGHWFSANGGVVSWGTDARLFSEYTPSTWTFLIGQYPSRSAIGDTYTIKQAMEYTNRSNKKIRVEFVFNVRIN
ncbi:DUF4859 domain-containing protein [Sphingobacterium bovistauri]|uniref:DUF4859 domain-containing protein n=1 Tax=Sphingobacterium bovistauri TaxID=2781959 RepID=A0ABS7Z2J0_9SPHI|nr:DUF4859 domain-containing protein [Sphingobacterium bovistauri]MCA5003827.1 DUF4859 domain-containing protein [Sphingobacterium bovistauri]